MTYSVVARDATTGNMGIAVQTHWFGVGNNVPWLQAGVGAIATQAQLEMKYGKQGLELLSQGKTPEQVIHEIGQTDDGFDFRQVAVVDTNGNLSAHTGKSCVKYAGYLLGDGFIVQGNILTNDTVLNAMKEAYEQNLQKEFAERLYLTIKAGEESGGELRGVQSASMRIVSSIKDSYDIINLRIDDHKAPLTELYRQIQIQKAYNYLNEAELEGEIGDMKKSLELFNNAQEILPDNKEVLFWKAFMLRNRGQNQSAQRILDEHFQGEQMWGELWKRIEGDL